MQHSDHAGWQGHSSPPAGMLWHSPNHHYALGQQPFLDQPPTYAARNDPAWEYYMHAMSLHGQPLSVKSFLDPYQRPFIDPNLHSSSMFNLPYHPASYVHPQQISHGDYFLPQLPPPHLPIGVYPHGVTPTPRHSSVSSNWEARPPHVDQVTVKSIDSVCGRCHTALSPTSGPKTAHQAPPTSIVARGPPRRPKQSGHALWIGNLPFGITLGDLKDHFALDATENIESVSLLRNSNCAFVNYKTEQACRAAHARLHHSRLRSARLVCRMRPDPTRKKGDVAITPESSAGSDGARSEAGEDHIDGRGSQSPGLVRDEPLIVGHGKAASEPSTPSAPAPEFDHSDRRSATTSPSPPPSLTESQDEESVASTASSTTSQRPGSTARYFIVKSLTLQDVQASLHSGTWMTQPHNQAVFDDAYTHADNVFLIFSINKSGEYFGYARMTSASSRSFFDELPGLDRCRPAAPQPAPSSSNITPPQTTTVCPATATAPAGIIYEDSTRGTYFWEVSSADARSSVDGPDDGIINNGSSDGDASFSSAAAAAALAARPQQTHSFRVEWRSIRCVPFQRVRGLRNPWNDGKEVKVARDGTELETSVGAKLLQIFHAPSLPVW